MDNKKLALFQEFLKVFPVERVKKINLDEYTKVGDKNTFTYWLESKLDTVGGIWGGSSFKFGIFNRLDKEEKESSRSRTYRDNYAWYTKYGLNEAEVFKEVKRLIIEVIENAQKGLLEEIDAINLGDIYKWKIAFHYQNQEYPKIIPVFRRDALNAYFGSNIDSMPELYNMFKLGSIEEAIKKAEEVWLEYTKQIDPDFKIADEIYQEMQSDGEEIPDVDEGERRSTDKKITAINRDGSFACKVKKLERYTCQACGFYYENRIVQAHHLDPLCNRGKNRKTKPEDVITLCPTCHMLAHYLLRTDNKFKERNTLKSELSKIRDSLAEE